MTQPILQTSGRIAVELCAGLGGIGIGLRELGFEVARAYDFWGEAVAVYNHNLRGDIAVECNLLSGKGRALVQADCRQLGEIDLLAAGPPCKGFSQLRNGRHDGRNGHNRVLAAMPSYVALIRPRMFMIENVPDLIRHRQGKTFAGLLNQLESPDDHLRYRVEYKVYDAAWFGTPQARRRIIILGVRYGAGNERLPDPGPDLRALFAAIRHGSSVPDEFAAHSGALRDPDDRRLTSASQALSDLPVLGPGELGHEYEYSGPPQTAYQRWVRRNAPERLQDMRTPAVNDVTVNRLKYIPPGGCAAVIPKEHLNGLSRRYGSAYRRLHPDAPSTALSTKYDCIYHYALPRSLSVREYARLQGIPDRITFPSNLICRRSAYEMIGNSVPPLMIERILREALEANGGANQK
jgi:DNA (cytosine-5)-methyltransferase 1